MRGLCALPLLLIACGKTPKTVVPVEGWHAEEDWPGECFYPVNYDQLGPGDRKLARQAALVAMMEQWNGQRGDGVSFDTVGVTNMETVLLGEPDRIEDISRQNLEQCITARNTGATGAWETWLVGAQNAAREGQCKSQPLRYTLFDYLNIGSSWHIPAGVCQGDVVRVQGTMSDSYRITTDGPWINVAGDTSQPALAGDLPCNTEGCFAGQLIMRFTADSGVQTVLPVGSERVWTAPGHGVIEVMINDTTFYDNVYMIESGIEHHASIEYSPVD